MLLTHTAVLALGLTPLVAAGVALDVNPSDPQDVYEVSRLLSKRLFAYYHGNQTGQTAGIFDNTDNSWWLNSAAFDSLAEYTARTGDQDYVGAIVGGVWNQAGEGARFEPKNQSATLDNEDVTSWALTAMTLAERRFSGPSVSGFRWDKLADNAFQALAKRWDASACGGGLRAALSDSSKSEYNLITAGAMSNFFQLAARLYRFTGDKSYGGWAETIYEWSREIGLVDAAENVYWSANVQHQCSNDTLNRQQWTMDSGSFFYGIGVMMGMTEHDPFDHNIGTYLEWRQRYTTHGAAIGHFRANDQSALIETECSTAGSCNSSEVTAYKGVALNWYYGGDHAVSDNLPMTKSLFLHSAVEGAAACGGSPGDHSCSSDWSQGWTVDGGLVAVLSSLNAVMTLMDSPVAATWPTFADSPRLMNGKHFMLPHDKWPSVASD